MLKIGLTGGIGSGKTLVAKVFSLLGVPVYYADDAAKTLMISDAGLRDALHNAFGGGIYNQQGINRQQFAEKIFNNAAALQLANSIIHPYVFRDFEQWCIRQSGSPYVIMETAILLESGAHAMMDHSVVVVAPAETRIHRVMQRDAVNRESVLARMRNQVSDEERNRIAGFLLYNDEEHLLLPQVLDIHAKITGKNIVYHI